MNGLLGSRCGKIGSATLTASEVVARRSPQDNPRADDHIQLRSCDRMDIVAPDPTSVYRYYDPESVLLYVGITRRGAIRNSEHNRSKEWWPYVARQAVDHYPTRAEALGREKSLIRKYRPPFNVQHNPGHAETRELYLAQASTLQAAKAEAGAGLSRRARQLLTTLEHRLPVDRVRHRGALVVYGTNPRHFTLAREVIWEPGAILRDITKVGVLSAVQVDPRGKRVFLVFKLKQDAKTPGRAVMKLRALRHPIRARLYEVVAG